MKVSPSMGQVPLRLLFVFTLFSSILAQVTWTQFSNSFHLYPGTGPGGCDRDAPNGVGMKDYVLTSLNDAWTASNTVMEDLPTSVFSYKRDTRGLLFLLFGVTFTYAFDPNPNDGSDTKYNYILEIFTKINKLKTDPDPNSFYGLGRFRCLEDYATYYQHMPGNDGRENMTAALAAEFYDVRMSNGNYFPGLMYVNNEAITSYEDPSDGFYPPEEGNPPDGACGMVGRYTSEAFCLTGGDVEAIYGITLCPNVFNSPTTSSLGSPAANGGTAEIDRFKSTGGIVILHEFVHLVSYNDVIDQKAAYPPDGVTWTNRDWASWVLNSLEWSYGYTPAAYLGLSMPALALYNADNYAILATCMQYDSLDCLGTFQNDIISKRKLPFQVSSRTVEKIRSGELDLKKDDITIDTSEGFASLYQSEVGAAGSLEPRNSIGETGKHPNRFKDV